MIRSVVYATKILIGRTGSFEKVSSANILIIAFNIICATTYKLV